MKSYFESRIDSVKRAPRVIRITVGVLLVLGGLLGFFPILGFWMIPLGLIVLAVDFRWARHALVNLKLRWRAYRRRYHPKKKNGTRSLGGGSVQGADGRGK
jgi:hypothetical protein